MNLSGKKGLVFGVANKNSIAWGISQALHAEGAEMGFAYAGEILEKRVRPLADSMNSPLVMSCDVTKDQEVDAAFQQAQKVFGTIDFLVHSIAFAPKEELMGNFRETTRAGFHLAMDISCFSLITLAQKASELMPAGGSIVTMTYFGAEKVTPNYNVMGVAKAALEASVRYLAWDLGKDKIRVNAISAGPIRTLAASGISGFRKSQEYIGKVAPRGNVTQQDIGDMAQFLLSGKSGGITGEIIHVDGGYNIMGAPDEEMIAGIL